MVAGSSDAEQLFLDALQTKTGAKQWPKIAELIQTRNSHAVVVEALSKTIDGLGKNKNSKLRIPLVAQLLGSCTVPLSPQYVRSQLGVSDAMRRKAVSIYTGRTKITQESKKKIETRLDASYDSTGRPHLRLHSMVQNITEEFFKEHTHLDSDTGARASLTRKLTLPKWELSSIFFAQYPALLRTYAHHCPPIVEGKILTKLQRDVQTALYVASRPGFDEITEFKERKQRADKRYLDLLARKILIRNKVPVPIQQTGAKRLPESFAPETHEITPPSDVPFWNILEERKVRYTVVEHATRCPIHDDGPSKQKQLDIVVEELRVLQELVSKNGGLYTKDMATRKQELLSAKRNLDKALQRYHWHCRQYEIQRQKVKAIEKALKVGECVLYRDFVNDHDESGAKICNLVFVLRQRVEADGPLITTNIHNIADAESCDAFFNADCCDFHFQKGDSTHSGLFDNITRITIVGDHGPHFSALETIYNETTFHKKYGKLVRSIFLCSYHAYNRCDGAGVVPKRLSMQAQREGAGPLGASQYVHSVNMSRYQNHVAFFFPEINRGVDLFPELEHHTNLRSMCDFRYYYVGADGERRYEAGVACIKYVSDDTEAYQVVDLVKRKSMCEMCDLCSQELQRPVRHGVEGISCPYLKKLSSENVGMTMDRTKLAEPDPARIIGPQIVKRSHKRKRKAPDRKGAVRRMESQGSVYRFQCKSALCDRQFKTARGANRHMGQVHKNEELKQYEIPVVKRRRAPLKSTTRPGGMSCVRM